LHLGYTRDGSWSILETIDLANTALVITENDIESYNTRSQSLLLTPEASSRFISNYGDRYLAININHHAFVVILNGERLYGGLMLDPNSQMGISYPVIYPKMDLDKRVHLEIRPNNFGYQNPASLDGIVSPKIYKAFRQKGKLIE
jgi:hypothetical protein